MNQLVQDSVAAYKDLEQYENEVFDKLVFTVSPKQINSSRAYKFVVRDQLGRDWLFKSGPASSADGALAVYRISHLLGIASPEMHYKKLVVNGLAIYGSLQRVAEDVEPFSGDWGTLSEHAKNYVLQNQLLSWLVANHHIHNEQFLISKKLDSNKNELTKIDNSINWTLLGNDSLTVEYRSPQLHHSAFAGYFDFWKEYLYSGEKFKSLLKENKFDVKYINSFNLDLKKNLILSRYASLIPDAYYGQFFAQCVKNNLLYTSNNEAGSIAWLTPMFFLQADKSKFTETLIERKNSMYADYQKFYKHLATLRGEKFDNVVSDEELKKAIKKIIKQYSLEKENLQETDKKLQKITDQKPQQNLEIASSLQMYRIVARLGDSLRFSQKSQLFELIKDLNSDLNTYSPQSELEKQSIANAKENLEALKTYTTQNKYQKLFYFWIAINANQLFEKDYVKRKLENNPFQILK